MTMQTKHAPGARDPIWRALIWSGAAALLLLPWIAMQFSDEVVWTGSDFAVFGAMLLAACTACEIAARASFDPFHRLAFGIAIGTGFLLVWINLAVGIIGSEHDSANLMFAGVLALALVASLMARLRPRGMARAMTATAIAQALVAVIVLAMGLLKPFVLTALFVVPWCVSAWLFARSARA